MHRALDTKPHNGINNYTLELPIAAAYPWQKVHGGKMRFAVF